MDGITHQPARLLVGFACVLAVLIGSAAIAYAIPAGFDASGATARKRVWTWWLVCAVLGGALLLGWPATTLVFGLISFIALREFLTLAPTRRQDRLVVLFVYLACAASYGAICIDKYAYFLVIVPIYAFVLTALLMALFGRSDGFLATAGILQWGMIVCVYNIGHAAFLMRTPAAEVPQAGPAGLVFFLLVITRFADFAQAASDRLVGRRRISARISETHSWEGLALATALSCLAFVLMGPFFSPMPLWPRLFVGALLPLWAVAGRLTMAAVKRDLGVKSSSAMLPGFGGMLDAVASLSFTAPWFFHMHAIFALERF